MIDRSTTVVYHHGYGRLLSVGNNDNNKSHWKEKEKMKNVMYEVRLMKQDNVVVTLFFSFWFVLWIFYCNCANYKGVLKGLINEYFTRLWL